MPQLSLYIDKEVLQKITKAAKNEKVSVSKWVSAKLRIILNNSWPEGYFDLFGSIHDDTFTNPENISFKNDSRRELF